MRFRLAALGACQVVHAEGEVAEVQSDVMASGPLDVPKLVAHLRELEDAGRAFERVLGLGQLAGLERVSQRVVGRGREGGGGRGSSCAEARGARTSVDTARKAVRPSNLRDGAACRMLNWYNCSQQSAPTEAAVRVVLV